MAAQVERLGGGARIQHRDVQVGHGARRARRDGRALGGRVIAGDGHCAALWIRTRKHRVTQRICGTVHARGLAVPDTDDAVVAGVGACRGQLAAHDRSGGLLLVHGGRMDDRQISRCTRRRYRSVVAAQRRAGISRHERSGAQSASTVGPQLLDRQPGQGLQPGHERHAVVVGIAPRQPVRLCEAHHDTPGVECAAVTSMTPLWPLGSATRSSQSAPADRQRSTLRDSASRSPPSLQSAHQHQSDHVRSLPWAHASPRRQFLELPGGALVEVRLPHPHPCIV